MALVRWQPADIFDLSRDANRLFGNFWGNGNGNGSANDTNDTARPLVWRPSVDIAESKDEYVLSADLPGASRDDLEVTVVDGRLTISGQRTKNGESEEKSTHTERLYGTFTRSFDLPAAVSADRIIAIYRDGVLTVTVPKAEEAKPKQIEVKISA